MHEQEELEEIEIEIAQFFEATYDPDDPYHEEGQ